MSSPRGRSGQIGLEGGQQGEFGHETVVLEGQFPVDTRSKCVPLHFLFQERACLQSPLLALCEPIEGQACYQLACCFGNNMVVGGRPPATEAIEVPLVPPDLIDRVTILLEQVSELPTIPRAASGPTPR